MTLTLILTGADALPRGRGTGAGRARRASSGRTADGSTVVTLTWSSRGQVDGHAVAKAG